MNQIIASPRDVGMTEAIALQGMPVYQGEAARQHALSSQRLRSPGERLGNYFDVKVGQALVRVRGGDGLMPDIVARIALPPETLIKIGEAVALHYRERGWKLPR